MHEYKYKLTCYSGESIVLTINSKNFGTAWDYAMHMKNSIAELTGEIWFVMIVKE